MIGRLEGVVKHRAGNSLLIDVHGVGFEVECSTHCLDGIAADGKVVVVVHTDVRQDNITLYGFRDFIEKQIFLLLRTVQGVGSKMASAILSQSDSHQLLRVIGSGDTAMLQSVRGVGKKTAERIVLELKEKVAHFALSGREGGLNVEVDRGEPYKDAFEALCSLGFSVADSRKALQKVRDLNISTVDSGVLIKEALRFV